MPSDNVIGVAKELAERYGMTFGDVPSVEKAYSSGSPES